jgi:Phosphotransferase enzyme family
VAASTLPLTLSDVTAEWLTAALREGGVIHSSAVTSFDWSVLGEGVGFIGQLGRVSLRYDAPEPGAPASVIAKFPSPIAQNRGFGVVAGLYETEIRFYHELAGRVPVRVPRLYYGAFDPEPGSSRAVAWVLERLPGRVTMALLGTLTKAAAKNGRRYALLIEDLGSTRVGDQVAGCGVDEARAALRALARLHASMWNSPDLRRAWLRGIDADAPLVYGLFKRTWPLFTERYRRHLPNVEAIGAWLNRNGEDILRRFARPPFTLLHGDYRLDNLFFDAADGGPDGVTVIDFQGIRIGNGMVDVAYFLRPNLAPEHADASEERLVRAYHDELVARGVRDYPWEDCRRDYTLAQAWLAMQGAFLLGALDLSHERGVELIDRAVERSSPSLARLDLAALEV